MVNIACAFTGHRPKKLPWRYDETDSRCVALKEKLTEQIARLAEAGVTDFFSGMAEGTDVYCAQIVLDLRKKKTRAEPPLCPALRGAGGWVVSFSAGTLSFHFGAGGRGRVCEPGVPGWLYAQT